MSANKEAMRNLGFAEAEKLLRLDISAEKDKATKQSWPGDYNTQLLADAVEKREKFVIFEPNRKFSIRYDDAKGVVFVKPTDGNFVPCGYFTYQSLKEVSSEQSDS